MASLSSSPPQSSHQFLTSVLSRRGPSALPYAEDVKWMIRQHFLSLADAFPALHPQTAAYTHNDGRTVNLLRVEGNIPMVYLQVTYYIPIVVWLMEAYPRQPPCVYVNPTRQMVIKRPHPHVNPSGLVSLPYLQNWIYPTSNLADLARNLSLVAFRPSSPHRPAADRTQVHRNAVNRLADRLHGDSEVLRKTREAEMEELFNAQAVLRQRESRFRRVEEMQDEKEGLELQLQMILINSDIMEAWLRENQGRGQMLECSSSDLAIDDVIYALDKALQEGQSLRSQFLHRAMSAKARLHSCRLMSLVWPRGHHHNTLYENPCL
ncbi:hypothetical protein AAG906_020830 [Vitis piasezkii]